MLGSSSELLGYRMVPSRFEFNVNIAAPAALIGDAGRAAILMSLMDGRRRTAGELAAIANLSPQSASGHLTRLRDGGMLTCQTEGRRRFYSLAGSQVGRAIETLLALAPNGNPEALQLGPTQALRTARTCYDHLAGMFGVQLHDSLLSRKLFRPSGDGIYRLMPVADRFFLHELGIDLDVLRANKRPLARSCNDWTEQRPHLSGALGAAMLTTFMGRGWFKPVRPHRALEMTALGRQAFARLGIDPPPAVAPKGEKRQ
jgi:DNA-binding transcriptional ArsR family regulator